MTPRAGGAVRVAPADLHAGGVGLIGRIALSSPASIAARPRRGRRGEHPRRGAAEILITWGGRTCGRLADQRGP